MSVRKLLLSCLLFTQLISTVFGATCQERWSEIHNNYSDLAEYSSLDGLCGDEFKDSLARLIATNIDLSYRGARNEMFSFLDNVDGEVCGVYTGVCIKTNRIPNGSVMNCEHSWPQSLGAVGIAKDDLHHLFPVDSKVNSRRSNHPLCVVANVRWTGGGSTYGTDEDGDRCFEPRDEHKGDVARAMLYFSLRYHKRLDAKQEGFFRAWMSLDPISDKEIKRNNEIEELQKNRNPFIDIPEFVGLITDF